MSYLAVNGVTLKTPKKFQFDIEDIDNESGRNANGDMIRFVVARKVKLNLEWGSLTDSEVSTILKALKEPFFQVAYPDAEQGKIVTKTFYAGGKSTPAYSWHPTLPKWEGLSVNLIER